MGEHKRALKTSSQAAQEPMIVDTPGGRIHVRWDTQTSATPSAQLAFFAEFLQTTGIWDAWIQNSTYELAAFGQLYRDRADAENGFDELKNQWGWGGFTTQDLARNQPKKSSCPLKNGKSADKSIG